MRFLIFASIFLSVFALLSWYISRRFVNRVDFKPGTKLLFKTFLVLNFIGIIFYMLSRYYISVPAPLYFLFSLPIGVIFILFISTLFYEIFHLLIHVSPNEKRRDFFKRSLDLGSVALASSVTAKSVYNAQHTYLEKVDVTIKDLQKEYTIVQLSDVHIGGLIDHEFIASIVHRVNALKPDVIAITGDLIDTDISYVKDAINELGNLKSTYGTYFVVGNHEYFHGARTIMDYLTTLGIHCLENSNTYIGEQGQGFHLAGVYDVFGYRTEDLKPDINKALIGTAQSPTVLLAHQPKFIEEVVNVDLVLSGHTHGGQIFPFNYLVKLAQPYIKGLHKHNEQTQIYVNKGTGFWGPPMRLAASAEITHLTLKRG